MSIWSDCEKYDAYPFYGFPVKPKFENNYFLFEFPEGYSPNGSQTQSIAEELKVLYGSEITKVNDYYIKIKIDDKKLGRALYQHFLSIKSKIVDPKLITI